MKTVFQKFNLLLALFAAFPLSGLGRDWFVNIETGSDQAEGTQGFPLATAQAAVDRAQPGDRVLLFPEKAIYRQSMVLNKNQQSLVIEGNGVTLTGSSPLPADQWETVSDDLRRIRLPKTALNRHLLIVNQKAERMGRLCENPIDFPEAEELAEGQFRWDDIDDKEGWLTYRGDVAGLEWSTRTNGVATSGNVRNVKFFNLAAIRFLNDGFNIHGNCRGIQFHNIAGVENFDEGFSAHDTSSCWIQQGRFSRNQHAVADVNEADTYYEDCEFSDSFAVEVLFHGGRHSLTRCKITAGPTATLLKIRSATSRNDQSKAIPANLVMRDVTIDASKTSDRTWDVGPGSTVFVDLTSSQQLAPLALIKHPTAKISQDLYRLEPIGRMESGSPIMTWVGGGTGTPRPGSYRIIHLGKHSPGEVTSNISPDNDWFGLMSPLPTSDFPPKGNAFAPENEAAHAIWRWIGISAPNAVFVPDTPEGRALAEALRSYPPAGVGMVDVFLSTPDRKGETVTSVLPRLVDNTTRAKEMMIGRLDRSPREVFDQLAPHYGTQFDGSYIHALALIAKMKAGSETRARELAQAITAEPLPKSGGQLSGTLLFAEINTPWAVNRVAQVADLAFDESGKPKEAMPFHNEMSDAVFMAGPILAQAGRLTGEKRYFDQAAQQVRFIQGLCLRNDGLYRHSPLNEAAWGRGNGFPALGIAMILDSFPNDHPDRKFLEDSVREHLEALSRHQSTGGMWHQLIDLPDSYTEFTSTCMIAYSIARGIDQGWLDSAAWRPRLLLAWEGIKARISNDGKTLFNVCEGTGKQKTLEDYYRRRAILGPDPRGGAMALLLSSEMIRWFERESQ